MLIIDGKYYDVLFIIIATKAAQQVGLKLIRFKIRSFTWMIKGGTMLAHVVGLTTKNSNFCYSRIFEWRMGGLCFKRKWAYQDCAVNCCRSFLFTMGSSIWLIVPCKDSFDVAMSVYVCVYWVAFLYFKISDTHHFLPFLKQHNVILGPIYHDSATCGWPDYIQSQMLSDNVVAT